MSAPSFNFTRNPSVKVGVSVAVSGLVTADDTLVIIGRRAASGGSATSNVPVLITNYGDYSAVVAECTTRFGASSEIGDMIVAAIKGVALSDLATKRYPKIKAIAVANDDDSSDLAATLAANIAMPMPFVVVPYAATDTTARAALKAHLQTISASDRGANAQFGSFGFMGLHDTLSNSTAAGEAIASELICIPWLRDAAPAQSLVKTVSAYAGVCASLAVPYLPLNGVKVGGLLPPTAASDYHTSGDAGTISLGLDSGLVPLFVDQDGAVRISRSVTASRRVSGVVDSSYYDMQDWQKMYYFRKNAYNLAKQPRYATAHATDAKLLSLRSELIATAKDFEKLEMFQYVDKLAEFFTVTRVSGNRNAAVYGVPLNVVPGFHNIGIGAEGSTTFDSFEL